MFENNSLAWFYSTRFHWIFRQRIERGNCFCLSFHRTRWRPVFLALGRKEKASVRSWISLSSGEFRHLRCLENQSQWRMRRMLSGKAYPYRCGVWTTCNMRLSMGKTQGLALWISDFSFKTKQKAKRKTPAKLLVVKPSLKSQRVCHSSFQGQLL